MKKIIYTLMLVLFTAQVFSQTTITVVSPNGGENWIIGCPSQIQWISSNTAGPVKIELFRNNAFYMTICNQVPAGMNTYTWIPPFNVIPGNNFKVKITSLTSAAAFDFSDNNFSISKGSILVGSPNGGETWVKGTMHPILWTGNICENVRIELWKGGLFNSVIASSVPSTGTFNWLIPNMTTLIPGNDYKVKIISMSNPAGTNSLVFDFSDNDFTISAGQNNGPVTVIAPNGGETWIIGCPGIIQWISTTPALQVKIELFKNNMFYMTICNQVPAGQSSFTWIPPFTIIPGNTFKVKVSVLTGTTGYDFSDGNFSINTGSITVGSPNGGETWQKGTTHPILWTDNLCFNVRIELWKGGVFNSVIAASVPSTGTFNWVIPNTTPLIPGNDYKVKIMNVPVTGSNTNLVFDFSDNNFSIVAGPNNTPIVVIAPNGGENWIIGCPNLIKWITVAAPSAPVRIELYKNGAYCMTICQQVPVGQNTFNWTPPYSLVPDSNYKVKVSLLTSSAGFDFSDGNFSINRGSISVLSPNGGEIWVKGTMHPILWTDNICENVRIELWKGGVFKSVIAFSVPSNGSFNWMIPNVNMLVPGNDYKIKIMNMPNPANLTAIVFDYSDNYFSIAAASPNKVVQVNSCNVYPNPFSNELHVTVADAAGVAVTIEIMNINGDLMLTQSVGNISAHETSHLNTSELPHGKYLLLVKKNEVIISRHHLLLIR